MDCWSHSADWSAKDGISISSFRPGAEDGQLRSRHD